MAVRAVLALVLVVLAPSVSAEPMLENPEVWDTVLFVHPGGFADGTLSPEPVPDEVVQPPGRRSVTECEDGLLTATWLIDPASGPVNYTRTPAGWDAQIHGNAPLANLTIGQDSVRLDWYVQLNGTATGLQDAVLEATLFDRDSHAHQPVIGRSTPEPYVTAATEPADLTPTLSGHPDVSVHDVDGDTVYGFHIGFPLETDLEIKDARSDMPGAGHGFHLRVVLQGDDVACRAGTAFGREILLHSSPGLRPTMEYRQLDPAWIQAVRPFAADGALGIAVDLGHPFGSGGLWIPSTAPMRIEGPAGLPILEYTTLGNHVIPLEKGDERWPIDHSHGYPGTVTQTWSLERAPPGTYTATWTVQDNLRGADATVTVEFEVSSAADVAACYPEGDSTVCQALDGSPGEQAPVHWALALLAILWCLRRRR